MSSFGVSWVDDIGLDRALFPKLEQAIGQVLSHQDVAQGSTLTVWVADDEALRQLNREYLHKDEPTDVLSFASGDIDSESGYLGDVAVSVPQAGRQAKHAGHSLIAELQLLLVHATLHLLGHDHATSPEKALMWRAQAEVIRALGIEVTIPE